MKIKIKLLEGGKMPAKGSEGAANENARIL